MSIAANPRGHLVERAAEMMGRQGTLPAWRSAGTELLTPASPLPAEKPSPAPAPPPIGLERLQAAGLLLSQDSRVRSRVIEEIAIIQHQMLRTIQDGPRAASPQGRIVLVASALRGEGKTFTALNLAASAANGAQGVVLVDVDGRSGGCSHVFGVADRPGLRQLASDPSLRAAGLPLPTAVERLSFLPYGGAVPGSERDVPSGATLTAAIMRLAAELPRHLIILDTPPSLSTSESSTLASIAGQVILVVNAERTQRNEVEAALDMLDACPVLQLTLNRVRFSANDTFGAHGDYGAPDAG